MGCPGRPAPPASECGSEWGSERAAASARPGPHMGSPCGRRSRRTDQSRCSHMGCGSTASARRTRSGPFVGGIWSGRAARADVGFTGARALLGRTPSCTIMGSAQTRGPTDAGAIVGSAAFRATPGVAPRGSARHRGPCVGESSCGAVVGCARNAFHCGRARPGLGSAGAVMGCPGGGRPERTPRSRAVLGRACPWDCRLGRAQERRTGRARGAELVELASASASHGRATASASERRPAARDFSAQRGAIVVATGRARGLTEVPRAAAGGDCGFAPRPGPRAGTTAVGVAFGISATGSGAARRTHPGCGRNSSRLERGSRRCTRCHRPDAGLAATAGRDLAAGGNAAAWWSNPTPAIRGRRRPPG